jgi:hypothetical protein
LLAVRRRFSRAIRSINATAVSQTVVGAALLLPLAITHLPALAANTSPCGHPWAPR